MLCTLLGAKPHHEIFFSQIESVITLDFVCFCSVSSWYVNVKPKRLVKIFENLPSQRQFFPLRVLHASTGSLTFGRTTTGGAVAGSGTPWGPPIPRPPSRRPWSTALRTTRWRPPRPSSTLTCWQPPRTGPTRPGPLTSSLTQSWRRPSTGKWTIKKVSCYKLLEIEIIRPYQQNRHRCNFSKEFPRTQKPLHMEIRLFSSRGIFPTGWGQFLEQPL